MKLEKLINSEFQRALGELGTKSLPPAIAFRFRGIIKKVQEELTKFEEVRKAGLEELAEKDEDGKIKTDKEGLVVFPGKNKEEMQKRLKELCEVEVEIPTVKLSELGSKVEISGFDALALDGLLVE